MNDEIKAMLKVPGKHKVSTPFEWQCRGKYAVVEVTKDGEVYQLNPKGEHDGLLVDDGWLPEAIEVTEDMFEARARK